MAYVKEATEEYVEQRIASALSGAMSGMFVVVNALPQAGEAGKIYLVPNNGGESGNVRDEYMWVNGAWELIGSTQVDLSGYYDKTAADGRFVQKEAGKGLSANDYTNEDKAKVAAALTAHQDISGKASVADLPYALVEPGEWAFSPYPDGVTSVEFLGYSSGDGWGISVNGDAPVYTGLNDTNAVELEWDVYGDGTCMITATRPSLPGHLFDRAVNAVAATGATTLTLPAANSGKARDFLVRLAISGSTVPTITFAAPTGETIVYETDGDEFPVPDEAGNWLYSFTETVAHTFAVSLKKVNTVTQGGA